jgi:hypothetical protein
LAHGLSNVINQMKCWDETNEARVLILMNMLCLLSTQVQNSLPYHIPKGEISDWTTIFSILFHVFSVESNDLLYGTDENFLNEIHQRLTRICEQIIQILKDLATSVRREKILSE